MKAKKREEHMIAKDPQYGAILLPFFKCAASGKPHCCPILMDVAGNVMIGGWVQWREPCSEPFPRLVSCRSHSAWTEKDSSTRE
jgi:hypothetical protein